MYAVHISESKLLDLPGRDVRVFIGTERLHSDRMTVGLTEVPPQTAMTPHTHTDKEEIIFILEGYGEADVGGAIEVLEAYTAVQFPIGVQHQVINKSRNPMRFVFAFSPVNDFGMSTEERGTPR